MRSLRHFIFLVIGVCHWSSAIALTDAEKVVAANQLAQHIELFRSMTQTFHEICSVPNAETGVLEFAQDSIFGNHVVNPDDGVMDCNSQLVALARTKEALESMALELADGDQAIFCGGIGETLGGDGVSTAQGGLAAAERIPFNTSCGEIVIDNSCKRNFACAIGATIPGALPALAVMGCGGVAYNCGRQALESVFSSVSGAVEFAGDAVEWGVDKIDRSLQIATVGVANTANAVAGANQIVDQVTLLSDAEQRLVAELQRFADASNGEKANMLRNLGATMWNGVSDALLQNGGCIRWRNGVFGGECEEAAEDFCSAPCDQKLGMICQVVGYMAGELVLAALTGGTATVASTVGRVGYRVGATFVRSAGDVVAEIPGVQPYLQRAGRLRNLAGQGARATASAATQAVRLALEQLRFVRNLPLTRAIVEAAPRIGTGLQMAPRNRYVTAVWNGTTYVASALSAPIRQYLRMTEQMYEFGRQTARTGFATTRNAMDGAKTMVMANASRIPLRLEGEAALGNRVVHVRYTNRDGSSEDRYLLVGIESQAVPTTELLRAANAPAAPVRGPAPTAIIAPNPFTRVVESPESYPEIVATATVNYRVPRADIPRVAGQLRNDRGIDLDNLNLPIESGVSRVLTGDQRSLVLGEVLDRNLQARAADDLLDEVDWGNSALNPRNFEERRNRVIRALENMGLEGDEAIAKADDLFRSNLLGDYPSGALTPAAPVAPLAPSLIVGGTDDVARAVGGAVDPVPPVVTGGNTGAPRIADQPSLGTSPEIPSFERIEELRSQLRLLAQREGATFDELLNEIQRGTRGGTLAEADYGVYPERAGIDNFIQRYGITGDEATNLRNTFNATVNERRGLTMRNTRRDLEKNSQSTRTRELDCSQLNSIPNIADAFHAPSGCQEIVFDETVQGNYCSCNQHDPGKLKTRVIGPWLVPCASMASEYLTEMNQADVTALPRKGGLNRCYKVDVEAGSRCFHGGLGPTFRGFGGLAQMYCGDEREGEFQGLGPTIRTTSGPNGIVAARYAPMFRDGRLNAITDAGRRCLDASGSSVCSVNAIVDIRQQLATLRSTPGISPDEINDAEMYIEYLQGRIVMDEKGNLRCRGSSELATGACP